MEKIKISLSPVKRTSGQVFQKLKSQPINFDNLFPQCKALYFLLNTCCILFCFRCILEYPFRCIHYLVYFDSFWFPMSSLLSNVYFISVLLLSYKLELFFKCTLYICLHLSTSDSMPCGYQNSFWIWGLGGFGAMLTIYKELR